MRCGVRSGVSADHDISRATVSSHTTEHLRELSTLFVTAEFFKMKSVVGVVWVEEAILMVDVITNRQEGR
jgi:hypothetical protein